MKKRMFEVGQGQDGRGFSFSEIGGGTSSEVPTTVGRRRTSTREARVSTVQTTGTRVSRISRPPAAPSRRN